MKLIFAELPEDVWSLFEQACRSRLPAVLLFSVAVQSGQVSPTLLRWSA
jgi:hypothetical protein